MTKIRKYNGVYKLPIKKHTPVRRPQSDWLIYLDIPASFGNKYPYTPNFVQDISKGLENPLKLSNYTLDGELVCECGVIHNITKHQKGDWEETVRVEELLFGSPKPSLLTRVKERFKR